MGTKSPIITNWYFYWFI